ncbi:MAG: hypothetical protein A2Z85_01495 [Chlamydiae bacterium GWA2_50_15]|nr:MAG: hypothetical protein A2Z85_01495 [Chlamydiae bacterium GWA2_50_15]
MPANAPLIFIIILNWNGKDDTLACLASLQSVFYAPFRIVVVDNGSSDGSIDAIESAYPAVALLKNQENLGFAEGNNIGAQFALKEGADWIFLLNNDTVVEPGILSAFSAHFQTHPNSSLSGAVPFLFDQKSLTLDHLGGRWNAKKAQFDLIGKGAPFHEELFSRLPELDYACGCSLMIRRDVVEKIGLFDARFFLLWEEADFCLRAKRAGFLLSICKEALLRHKVSASFVGGKPQSRYYWWRNRLLFIELNVTPGPRVALYIKVLLPELVRLYKLLLLKNLHVFLSRLVRPGCDQAARLRKLQQIRASLKGIRDYFLRRFGKAGMC